MRQKSFASGFGPKDASAFSVQLRSLLEKRISCRLRARESAQESEIMTIIRNCPLFRPDAQE